MLLWTAIIYAKRAVAHFMCGARAVMSGDPSALPIILRWRHGIGFANPTRARSPQGPYAPRLPYRDDHSRLLFVACHARIVLALCFAIQGLKSMFPLARNAKPRARGRGGRPEADQSAHLIASRPLFSLHTFPFGSPRGERQNRARSVERDIPLSDTLRRP